jgi:NhaP-type Na+/H+ or K+/H+ antiporter
VLGLALGALGGYGIAAAAVWLRDREWLSADLDGWLSVPAVLTIYGLTELIGAYGFLAAFAGGVAFRRYEHTHEHNRRVHDGAEVVEKFGELAVILLIGSMFSLNAVDAPGLGGWLLVPVLLLVIRPAAVLISLVGTRRDWRERAFVAWFGVRGIGSLYYLAVAVGTGVLAGDAVVVVWTAIACVVVSVLVHGITATPISRRVLE